MQLVLFNDFEHYFTAMLHYRLTWVRLHSRAFTLQLLRERFLTRLMSSAEAVELPQL